MNDKAAGRASLRRSSRFGRMGLAAATLLGVVLIPFVLIGHTLEAWTSDLIRDARGAFLTAAIGVTLLAADVVLPIPASVVATAMGALLGMAAGTAVNVLGLTAGCIGGYSLGRIAGRPWAERRLGGDYARLASLLDRYGTSVLAICRAVPVLAEASVIAAGALGLSVVRSFAVLTAANLGVGGVYAILGASAVEASLPLAFAAAVLLPGLMLAGAAAVRRMSRPLSRPSAS